MGARIIKTESEVGVKSEEAKGIELSDASEHASKALTDDYTFTSKSESGVSIKETGHETKETNLDDSELTFDSPESSKASISAKGKRKKLIKRQKERNTNDIDTSTEIDDVPEKREREEKTIAPRKDDDKYLTIKSQNELTEKETKEKENPAFAVTLKKTQIVKQPIKEQKLEVVSLKHHDFERNPQQPVDEQISNVRLTLSVAEGEESIKTKKKLSKKKSKTKDTYDDLGEESEVSESKVKDKKVSEDSITSKIIDTAENPNKNDNENNSKKIKEEMEETVQVS